MKLMALDGNSIVNRAYYGVKLLSTSEGIYTNAIYGFLNILQKLLDEDNPDALCVTFDLKAPTFRHKLYKEYKSNRKPMPEELAMQLPLLKEILTAMNIPMYALEGWEADDLLGTISRKCENSGWDCQLVTGDRDALQLVTDRTHVLLVTTSKGQTSTREMTPEAFREEYGFDPIHLIDMKALMGDSSDNYPGVSGIGKKTASDLVQRYESVQNLYDNLETAELKPAQRKKLEAGRDSAFLCLDLAAIRTDAPLEFVPEDNLRKEWDRPAVYELFRKLEFKKMIERYDLHPGEASPEEVQSAETARTELLEVTGADQLAELLPLWEQAEYVTVLALDGLDGVAVRLETDGAARCWFLLENSYEGDYESALQSLFSEDIRKLTHGVKELSHQLLSQGLPADGFVFDTALAAYLLDPNSGHYSLDNLVMRYFHEEIPGKPDYQQDGIFSSFTEDREKLLSSWSQDAEWIASLRNLLKPQLEEENMYSLLTDLELPLCRVLAEMELAGVLVDREALSDFGVMLDAGIRDAETEIYRYAGKEFNINSTKQLGTVLFEDLGLPVIKKTKTGYSTSAEVLEKLKNCHPIINQILEYRQLSKLKSTYVDGLIKVIAEDGRIHTTFQNTVTATGRLSSTEPNLQNIPVRTELGAEMRKMFICAPGNVLVDADYSQIELRLLAHIADDKAMQEGFRSGVDIHTVTASQVFGVPVDQVTKSMRSSAKAVNFGIVYGISEYSLAQDLHVPVSEAKDYMNRYFEKYSGVHTYMKNVVEQAKKDGYVSTLWGRRRPIPELKESNHNQRAFGERVALNAPIQGTAADIIKLAMIRVQDRLKAEGLTGRLVLQVHDELIVECPEEEGSRVQTILKEEMEGAADLSVPLVVDGSIGHCWADAH